MKISVSKDQEHFLSGREKINNALKDSDVLGLDIYSDDKIIGFAMLKEFGEGLWFLWDYAIDAMYQNQGYGTESLICLIQYMKDHYGMKTMTTTYIMGNDTAERMYKNIGFKETGIVDEGNIHEVNMAYDSESRQQ